MDQEDKKLIFNILLNIYENIKKYIDSKITKNSICEEIESKINNLHDDFKFEINSLEINNEIIKINYAKKKSYYSIADNFMCNLNELKKIENLKKLN